MLRDTRAWRWLIALAAGGGAAAAVLTALWLGLAAAGVGPPGLVRLGGVAPFEERFAEIARERERFQVVLLGDSQLVAFPTYADRVPMQLRRELAKAGWGRRVYLVHELAAPGLGPYEFYFLAQRLADARPDLVILAFNLATLEDAWARHFGRPEMAGFLEWRRLPEALGLPLHRIGLTLDRLLLYMGLARTLGFEQWLAVMRAQSRVSEGWERLAEALSGGTRERFESARRERQRAQEWLRDRERLTGAALRERHRDLLAGVDVDHPVLRILAATLRTLGRAGVPTMVFVLPLDVEHLASQGIPYQSGVRRSVDSVLEVARSEGARAFDLHDALPDSAFRDVGGHLVIDHDFHGPRWLARAFRDRVLEVAPPSAH